MKALFIFARIPSEVRDINDEITLKKYTMFSGRYFYFEQLVSVGDGWLAVYREDKI